MINHTEQQTPETFTLALTNGEASVRLTLPMPLTEAQWTQVTGILEAVVQPTHVPAYSE